VWCISLSYLPPSLPPSLPPFSSGDFTARLWKLPGHNVIMADENGRPIYEEPVVLRHASKVRCLLSLLPALPCLTHAFTDSISLPLPPSLLPFRPQRRART